MDAYFRYWGKAQPAGENESRYHLLAWHGLDVAAVGWQLLDPEQTRCQQLAAELQVDPGWLQRWFAFCLALHDLGKFASGFQGLVSDLDKKLVTPGSRYTYSERHDSLGWWLWRDKLFKPLLSGPWKTRHKWRQSGAAADALRPWFHIVMGHHGQPPVERGNTSQAFSEADINAALDYTVAVAELLQPDFSPLHKPELQQRMCAVSWQLAGLTVLADWSGSSQRYFPYQSEGFALSEYWQQAQQQAVTAVAAMHPFPVEVAPFRNIQQLFPFIKTPTPLQQQAATVPLPEGPQLWIMEDVTGAGKTEAALTLASRMMSAGRAKGLYIGLPTMATANGIYKRMADDYRRLFTEQSQPSLVLAHSARNLSEIFTDSVRLSNQIEDQSYDADEPSASAFCNGWLADSRKKALFAELGVGTLDQALLAVLPARHQSLRLLALSERILLVDEVHAYDPYMQRLLESLLQAHAAQGGSAILLSATLPQAMRHSLCKAFRTGVGVEKPQLNQDAYPLLTGCSAAETVLEQSVESRPSVCRSLEVIRLGDPEQVKEKICAALAAGQAVCWIRNTVGDARAAWQRAYDERWTDRSRLMLFHSRFALCDRVAVEDEVLSCFGKKSDGEQRRGQLLIATQVVEQSLDLDFDFMVTDLAPVDLLIQRAGRLHRHSRDVQGDIAESDQRPAPVLAIHAPSPVANADQHWLKPHWQSSQWVYQDLGQLWLTLDALQNQRWQLRMPEDARVLIEHVYGDESPFNIPAGLEDSNLDAEGLRSAERRQAMVNRLDLSRGYSRDSSNGGWEEEVATPTRLADETVTVALVRLEGDELQPWCNDGEHRWQRSQISLPEKDWQAVNRLIPEALAEPLQQLKESVSELRWVEILPLVDMLADRYSAEGGWLKVE